MAIRLVTILILSFFWSLAQSQWRPFNEGPKSSRVQQDNQLPRPEQNPPKPTIWERARKTLSIVYSVLWDKERYKGNLANDANKNTEKGVNPGGNARLYLIDTVTHSHSEWVTARGATEPTVSPDGRYLFYRRGNRIFKESIRVEQKSVVSINKPKVLEGVEVKQLYACTLNRQRQPTLWTEDMQGKFSTVQFQNGKPAWGEIPELKGLSPDEIKSFMDEVRKFRSLRPDGFQAVVRDYHILGSTLNSNSLIRLDESPMKFFGNPTWVGKNSAFLFANAIFED